MKIFLNNIGEATRFAEICNKYEQYDVDVSRGKYMVDGKSFLGLLALGLNKELAVCILTNKESVKNGFHEDIKPFSV